MKAKDTVMKIGELLDIEEAVEDAAFSGQATDTKPVAIAKAQAKAQAEISFKAGYELGWNENKPYLPDANEPWDTERTIFDDGKKVGIREVVESISACRHGDDYGHSYLWLEDDKWQAKLKEWGLNNE